MTPGESHLRAATPARAQAQAAARTELTLDAAAKWADVSPRYLQQQLKHGVKAYVLAERLSALGFSEDALLRGGIKLPRSKKKGGEAKAMSRTRHTYGSDSLVER